jgi:hypothetical protein
MKKQWDTGDKELSKDLTAAEDHTQGINLYLSMSNACVTPFLCGVKLTHVILEVVYAH